MRLVAKNGPLAGTALTLSDGLTIPPGCAIRQSMDGFALHAPDNGTPVFVNGLPITTRRLEPHDELLIGDSLFLVHDDDHDDDPAVPSALSPCGVTMDRAGTRAPCSK